MILKKGLALAFLLLGLVSCGADKLKKPASSNISNLTAQNCTCIASYAPVCGSDGKDYDNSCLAQCFGARVIKAGHCDCSKSSTLVCGVDGANHTECEAKEQNIEIVKYIPCEAAGL